MDITSKIKDYLKHVDDVTKIITKDNADKIIRYIKQIPLLCTLNTESQRNKVLRDQHSKRYHPIKVFKGDIYNALITENTGSELSESHLVIIVQGFSSNVFGEKVTVLPIEGDGSKINPHYQIKLTNADLKEGKLDKDPSRIIFTDVLTLDKSRLDGKIGTLKPEKIEEVNNYLLMHLDIKKNKNSN